MCVTMAMCSTCKKLTAHTTIGEDADPDGKTFQTMKCSKCGTSMKVYTGKNGRDFQRNYEAPDNTETT